MPHVYVVDPKSRALRSLSGTMDEIYRACRLNFPMTLDAESTGLPGDPVCIIDATMMAMPVTDRFAWHPGGRIPVCVHGCMVLATYEIDQFHDYGPSPALEAVIMESVTMLPDGVPGWAVYAEVWETRSRTS